MTTVSDDFNRADSASLGANWTEAAGDGEISTNRLRLKTGGFANNIMIYSGSALSGVDQYIKVVSATADFYYPLAIFRYTNSSSAFYGMSITGNTGDVDWVYFTDTSDSGTSITSGSLGAAIGNGDNVSLTCVGTGTSTVIRGWRNTTANAPSSDGTTWDGNAAAFTLTTDPGSPVNSGSYIGVGGVQSAADFLVFQDFYGGDVGGGGSTVTGDGSISSTATVTGSGASTASASGSISATATPTGSSQSTATADGSITAVATVTGEGTVAGGVVEADGSITGAATVVGVGAAIASGDFDADATAAEGGVGGVLTMVGEGLASIQAAGSITTTATATGTGAATASVPGSITATQTQIGVGQATADGDFSSTSALIATGEGASSSSSPGDGYITASATVSGDAASVVAAAGSISGTADVQGVGAAQVIADGDIEITLDMVGSSESTTASSIPPGGRKPKKVREHDLIDALLADLSHDVHQLYEFF